MPSAGTANILPPPTSGWYNNIYNFKGGQNGYDPIGTLLNINGTFYGATYYGGSTKCYGLAYGCGTFYTVTPEGKQRVLYRFKPPGSVLPQGSFIEVNGALYGEAGGGTGDCGGLGCGTVFKISKSGAEKTVYNFQGDNQSISDGDGPVGGLRQMGGNLYGTTFQGGRYLYGTIFEVSLGGKEVVLHAFQGDTAKDGANPQAGLIEVNGTFYGTTSAGGGRDLQTCAQAFGNSCGTIFAITPQGQYHVLYRFGGGADAAYPLDELTYLNGVLYGTTFFGGGAGSGCPAGCGTVFEFDLVSGKEHVIYRFKGGADGFQPGATLLAYHGKLYGSTYLGGTGYGCLASGGIGCGTIFEITTAGVKTILHQFTAVGLPNDKVLVLAGKLYMTTPIGGPYCRPPLGCGTVFELTL